MRHRHLFLPFVLLALGFVSCGKHCDQQADEMFDQHPTWTSDSTNNFWEKRQGEGFRMETVWDDDTTINF